MKIINLDDKSAIIKINKNERLIFNKIISNDDFFNKKIKVSDIHSNNYLLSSIDLNINICIDYLNHCFAKETIEGIIKVLHKKVNN